MLEVFPHYAEPIRLIHRLLFKSFFGLGRRVSPDYQIDTIDLLPPPRINYLRLSRDMGSRLAKSCRNFSLTSSLNNPSEPKNLLLKFCDLML